MAVELAEGVSREGICDTQVAVRAASGRAASGCVWLGIPSVTPRKPGQTAQTMPELRLSYFNANTQESTNHGACGCRFQYFEFLHCRTSPVRRFTTESVCVCVSQLAVPRPSPPTPAYSKH